MPLFALRSTVDLPAGDARRAVVSGLSALAAAQFGKPETFFTASYTHDPDMSFAGTYEPNAILSIVRDSHVDAPCKVSRARQISIGDFDDTAKRERHAAAFFKFVEEKLGVPGDRMYMCVAPSPPLTPVMKPPTAPSWIPDQTTSRKCRYCASLPFAAEL
jgi:phenylpyruvate tautomerase